MDVLSAESERLLEDAQVLELFNIPKLQQNIPLIYVLLRCYCREKKSFHIGTKFLKVKVNEIAMILGLPNRGLEFKFSRVPLGHRTHKDLVEEIRTLAAQDSSPAKDIQSATLLVKYLLCVFLFPLKGLKIPCCLEEVKSLDDFKLYNWPLAIYKFFHAQFDHFSRVSAFRDSGTNLGYFEGCSIIMLVIC